ncbi:MAG: hypothetical protein AAF533_08525 [Acidobacteriota bacterium]
MTPSDPSQPRLRHRTAARAAALGALVLLAAQALAPALHLGLLPSLPAGPDAVVGWTADHPIWSQLPAGGCHDETSCAVCRGLFDPRPIASPSPPVVLTTVAVTTRPASPAAQASPATGLAAASPRGPPLLRA